jgi:hypothetical protein
MHTSCAIKFVITVLAMVVTSRTQGADVVDGTKSPDGFMMPVENGTTNRPVIAKHFDGNGWDAPRSILLCVWADGRVVWSTNSGTYRSAPRRLGGEPYFEGHIDAKVITALLSAVEAKGFFTNTVLQKKGHFLIHRSYWHWSILSDGRACQFSSALDFGVLSDEDILQRTRRQDLGDVVTAWRFLESEIQKAIPKTGRKAERFDFPVQRGS